MAGLLKNFLFSFLFGVTVKIQFLHFAQFNTIAKQSNKVHRHYKPVMETRLLGATRNIIFLHFISKYLLQCIFHPSTFNVLILTGPHIPILRLPLLGYSSFSVSFLTRLSGRQLQINISLVTHMFRIVKDCSSPSILELKLSHWPADPPCPTMTFPLPHLPV